MIKSLFFLSFLAFSASCGVSHAQTDEVSVPDAHRVVDLTNTLTPSQTHALISQLKAAEQKVVIGVLIVPTTKPETIFEYSQKAFDKWKLGNKVKSNGVLIVVAKNDRKVRIHTGYGVEGAIPDVVAQRIIRQEMVPQLKQGNFYQGISNSAGAIIKIVSAEPEAQPVHPQPQEVFNTLVWVFSFIGLVVLVIIGVGIYAVRKDNKKREEERHLREGSMMRSPKPMPLYPPARRQRKEKDDDSILPFVTGVVVGSALSHSDDNDRSSSRSSSSDDDSSSSSDNSFSSDSSDSGSMGGDSGGGGSDSSF